MFEKYQFLFSLIDFQKKHFINFFVKLFKFQNLLWVSTRSQEGQGLSVYWIQANHKIKNANTINMFITLMKDMDSKCLFRSSPMKEAQPRSSPFIIGVAGGSASGKSTVCEKIMENLRNKLKINSVIDDGSIF